MKTITGKAVAAVSKYTRFDPANPTGTAAHEFTLFGPSVVNADGLLSDYLVGEGYMVVGRAEITIELLPTKKVTEHAVATLRKQKEKVMADAQAEATSIERQIQSLLAIEHTT